ncbi:5-formyltetrahydrofolate cyclo-ligase [Methanosarcinaceae archaeon Ag5]|uniref:5-formyltetrahydrofolate cyclo-ligase n=1 Tax=Methanolapillus africanus TaxID=3028297 RepID=A0AAE4SDK6_9EURY|nr:5-formyltetrahydrofolate cyclo-ligase [Methanosarcinaceae archaeon Ag5]
MKQKVRNELRLKREKMSRPDVLAKSKPITVALLNSDLFQKAEIVFAYADVKNEVHTMPFLQDCFERNKPVALPKTVGNELIFYKISDLDSLKKGNFGILEPDTSDPELVPVLPDKKTLFVVPGIGFDRLGNRLGYGVGYFDKYLSKNGYMHAVGICFEDQLVDKIPTEDTDIRMDSVLTEKEWIFLKK